MKFLDGILILVSHKKIKLKGFNFFNNLLKKNNIFFDIHGIFNNRKIDFKL